MSLPSTNDLAYETVVLMAYCITFGSFMHRVILIQEFIFCYRPFAVLLCQMSLLQLVPRIVMFVLDLITSSTTNLCSLRTEQTQELYTRQ